MTGLVVYLFKPQVVFEGGWFRRRRKLVRGVKIEHVTFSDGDAGSYQPIQTLVDTTVECDEKDPAGCYVFTGQGRLQVF